MTMTDQNRSTTTILLCFIAFIASARNAQANPATTTIFFEDFDGGVTDVFVDMGHEARLNKNWKHSGSHSLKLRDDTGGSYAATGSYDVAAYGEVLVDFYVAARDLEEDEQFFLEYRVDNDSGWAVAGQYIADDHFESSPTSESVVWTHKDVSIDSTGASTMQIRFRSDTAVNTHRIFIDDITFAGVMNSSPSPSQSPIASPSASPIASPSASPSVSPAPSEYPSEIPSSFPSVSPSPSEYPSETPSSFPSQTPSASASPSQSSAPTYEPCEFLGLGLCADDRGKEWGNYCSVRPANGGSGNCVATGTESQQFFNDCQDYCNSQSDCLGLEMYEQPSDCAEGEAGMICSLIPEFDDPAIYGAPNMDAWCDNMPIDTTKYTIESYASADTESWALGIGIFDTVEGDTNPEYSCYVCEARTVVPPTDAPTSTL